MPYYVLRWMNLLSESLLLQRTKKPIFNLFFSCLLFAVHGEIVLELTFIYILSETDMSSRIECVHSMRWANASHEHSARRSGPSRGLQNACCPVQPRAIIAQSRVFRLLDWKSMKIHMFLAASFWMHAMPCYTNCRCHRRWTRRELEDEYAHIGIPLLLFY